MRTVIDAVPRICHIFFYAGSFIGSYRAPSASSTVSNVNLATRRARTSVASSRKDEITFGNQSHRKDSKKDSIVETLTITRLAGESLGLGLKFDGGSRASECVKKLFVQGC